MSKEVYQEYLNSYTTYSSKFGSKVAVFMMVGVFYELYDVRDPETGQGKTTFLELIEILGLKVTVKKGEGIGGLDGLVAGIPDYSIHKWAGRLTQMGWTVVLVEQVKNAAGKVIRREAQRILTPGSHIEAAQVGDVYFTFVSIEKEDLDRSANLPPWLSVVSLDLTTGYLRVFETQAQGTEDAWTSNELVQFMELYPPKEVLWSVKAPRSIYQSLTDSKLRSILGCSSSVVFHQRSPLQGAWLTPLFREEYLKTRCQIKNLLPTHTALHLAPGSHSETALISLLNALEELWPSLKLGALLTYPWTPGKMLHLGENALVQLHMIISNHDSNHDVLSLFDKCSTPMGHRSLRERLLKPSADLEEIRANLNAVEKWHTESPKYRDSVVKTLRSVSDLSRLYRKIQQGTLTATDLISIHTSLKSAEILLETEKDRMIQHDVETINTVLFSVFSKEKIYESNEDTSIFRTGLNSDIDHIESQIQGIYKLIKEWSSARTASINSVSDSLKIEMKEKSLVLRGPKTLIETLKKSGKLPAGCTAVVQKTISYLESPELDQAFIQLIRLRESLSKKQNLCLIDYGLSLSTTVLEPWIRLTTWLSSLDVNVTLARVAIEMGYTKPTIIEGSEGSISIQGLRHPLLESLDRKIPYVQHDIAFGLNQKQGWLLYGLNASGKSSLMRATGLAVLLAQGGSYVPASQMTLCPFSSLHTRIINTDNLWMGLSSFAVEMSEMRDIFLSAGPRSLVLGDELCSGTETTSATALVAAGLNGLLKRGARFLFATHLHGLNEISEVSKNPLLEIWHLHVEYNQALDKLIYHRKLKSGSGSSLYGLEVAKAMRIPSDILEDAIRFRRQIAREAELSHTIGSSWNTKIIRRTCESCGSSEADDLEVHHIKPRKLASTSGHLPDGSSVHAASNLVVLCDQCHDRIHTDTLTIHPLIQTSEGVERSISDSQSVISSRVSKWSEEELHTIETCLQKFSHLSLSNMCKYLKNNHLIDISSASLRKFRE
jgi:DNA mismatch repair protein MutS